jgi:N-acetylmuramoyl-L-alanine amidase
MLKSRVLVVLILLFSSAAFCETVLIEKIEVNRDRGYDYLDVYTSGPSQAQGLLLEDKLYLDFPETEIAKQIEISRRTSKRIQKIEVVQKDEHTSRIVVTLKGKIDYDIVNVFGRDKSVIEIGDRLEDLYAHQFAWESKDLKKIAPPLKPVKLSPEISPENSLLGKTIILDPGHGGDDPGAFSLGGIPEKVLTLQTAQKAAAQLRKNGATVYLTRNSDRRSNLKDIVEFANHSGADLFISLHYNSFSSSRVAGTETYYHHPASQKFAQKMHSAIVRGIARKDRGLSRTPFYVVKNITIPSVLLEPVYLTNPQESDLAQDASFQEELAKDVLKGVKDFLQWS